MNVSMRISVALALAAMSGGAMAQLPSGSAPVGQPAAAQQAPQVVAAPQALPAQQAAGLAGLPAGAQAAPVIGVVGQQGAPQNLPPLPVGAPIAAPDYESIMAQTLGLTPEQIRGLRREQNLRQKAASETPSTPPKPVTSSVQASPSPGSVAPVIRLFTGFSSAVTFVDSTGALWPIENYSIGNAAAFDIKRMDGDKGSMLTIVPLGSYAQSNLIVYLKGLSAPIAISFIAGQREVDFRTDVRVQGLGPNAQVSVGGLPASANSALLSLLEGVAPSGSKELRLSGGQGKAWLAKNGRMFLRTSNSVISPGWVGSMRSPDGTNVYEMMPANSIRILREGQIQTIGIEGW